MAEGVFHDAAIRLLDVQFGVNTSLNTRNGTVVSVASTVLPVTVGLLNLGSTSISAWAIMFLVIALGCYVLLLVCSWRASVIGSLEHRPASPHAGYLCRSVPWKCHAAMGRTTVLYICREQ